MPTSDGNSLAELLTEAAQPNLYRINAFRILELATDCGEMDISRRMRLIEIAGKTGAPIPPGSGRALPVETPPDHYACLDAAQRLRAPEQRFIDEFFWFWPHELGDGKGDEALAALKQSDLEQAVEIWTNYANNYTVDNVSVHNLAVLSHVSALDLEILGTAHVLTEAQLKKLDIYWRQTFKRWNNLMAQDGFWKRLSARVREFDDPRLDSTTVAAMHDSLPIGLLLINARLAVQSMERGDEAGVARHLQTVQLADFGQQPATEALTFALEPTRARIKTFCKTAEAQADADPVHANEVASSLLEQCAQPLRILDRLLPGGTPVREAAHDEVALRGLACVTTYANRTQDWRGSVTLLEKLLPVAASPSTCGRLEESLKTQRSNAESGNDWCGEGYYDLPEQILTPLEEARRHFQAREWDKAILILENLLNSKTDPLEDQYKPFVRMPLATCINLRGDDRVKVALNGLDEPRQIILDIKRRAANADFMWNMTAQAAQAGNAKAIASSVGLECMACGRRNLPHWYTFTSNDVTCLICDDCSSRDDSQMSARRRNFGNALVAFYEDLLFAEELDPTNKSIIENKEATRKAATKLNVSLPSRPSRYAGLAPKPLPAAAPAAAPAVRPGPAIRPGPAYVSPRLQTPAGIRRHFSAALVDFLVMGLITAITLSAAMAIFPFNNNNNPVFAAVALVLALSPFLAYYPVCVALFKRTLGERVTSTHLVDRNLTAVSVGRAAARWTTYVVMWVLSSALFFLWLAFLVPLLNSDRKSVPDLIFGTWLVMD